MILALHKTPISDTLQPNASTARNGLSGHYQGMRKHYSVSLAPMSSAMVQMCLVSDVKLCPRKTMRSSCLVRYSLYGGWFGRLGAKMTGMSVFLLKGIVSKCEYSFLSYRTGEYKLHYFETPTNLKFVMLTDTRIGNMRTVLHQIWANLYVEYVVKSPISPVEHPGGIGVANELFEGGLEGFMVSMSNAWYIILLMDCRTQSFHPRVDERPPDQYITTLDDC